MHPAACLLALESFVRTRRISIVSSSGWDGLEMEVQVNERRREGFSFAWHANVIRDRAIYFIALTRSMIAQFDLSMMSSSWNQAKSILMSNV